MRTSLVSGLFALGMALLPATSVQGAVDLLDTNLTVRIALGQVERSLFCKSREGTENRHRILRLIGEVERLSPWGMPPWAVCDLAGAKEGDFAYALLRQHAGTLFNRPEYAAAGRSAAERMIRENGGEAIRFRDEAVLPDEVKRYYALMQFNREDLRATVRQGGVEGRPFWNRASMVFIYPPAFEFRPVAGAARYRFDVIDDVHARHSFEAPSPQVALSPIWPELPAGQTTVICYGLDADGKTLGMAGERTFWRSAPFDPSEYRAATCSASEAHRKGFLYLMNLPEVAYLEQHGKPDLSAANNFVSYPSKMQSAVIEAMVAGARRYPGCRDRALRIARISADYLLSTAYPKGSPLEYFTPTYVGDWLISRLYAGQNMLVYPSESGCAFLHLYQATGESRYLKAAVNIAETYLRLQRDDGSWYLKVWEKDGAPVNPNRMIPTHVIEFLEELHAQTQDARYRQAADRAFTTIEEGPLKSWDWEGQFEDQPAQDVRYQNQTKHGACETALYLLRRYPGDRQRLAQAREIVRFAEDQFVIWKTPCRASGAGPWRPMYPFYAWRTPAVLEQYRCYAPIDASAAKLIRTYMALYAAEGRQLDLAKARALADSMINNQDESGRIRTYWIPEPGDTDNPIADEIRIPPGGDWFNCMAGDLKALDLMED